MLVDIRGSILSDAGSIPAISTGAHSLVVRSSFLRVACVKFSQDLCTMLGRLYIFKYVHDYAFFIDQESRAEHSLIFLTVVLFCPPYTVKLTHLVLTICQ